jgi:hypothetical protein
MVERITNTISIAGSAIAVSFLDFRQDCFDDQPNIPWGMPQAAAECNPLLEEWVLANLLASKLAIPIDTADTPHPWTACKRMRPWNRSRACLCAPV